MCELKPEWISAISAALAALAAFFALIAARYTYKLQKSIEKNRQAELINDALIKNIQSLLVTFANIRATTDEDWSPERTSKLQALSNELRYTCTVIESLNATIGEKIKLWRIEQSSEGYSISREIDYVLGNLGAGSGEKYNKFFSEKSESLIAIRNLAYKELIA